MCPHDACRAFENQVQIQSTETCECGTVISGRDKFDCLECAPLFHCEFWVWQTLSFKDRGSAFPRVTDSLRVAVMVRSLNLLDDRVSSAMGCVPMIRNLLTRRGKTWSSISPAESITVKSTIVGWTTSCVVALMGCATPTGVTSGSQESWNRLLLGQNTRPDVLNGLWWARGFWGTNATLLDARMDSCTGSRNSAEVLSSEPFLGNNPNPRQGTARVSSSLSLHPSGTYWPIVSPSVECVGSARPNSPPLVRALDPRFRIGNSSAKTVQTRMWSRSDRAGTARTADETWEWRGWDGEKWHAHCKHLSHACTRCLYGTQGKRVRKMCVRHGVYTPSHTAVATTWIRNPETKKNLQTSSFHFHLDFSHQHVVHQFAFHRSSLVNVSQFPEACSADFWWSRCVEFKPEIRFTAKCHFQLCESHISQSSFSGSRSSRSLWRLSDSWTDLLLCACLL